ncbi:unnamed protein product [Caenorhabditis auriculariae]|uniref:Uncharacterized protein n=1 Tax=Caenorhabditis auriculariae TaxID=2777116 RepID=A0A8S1HT12_9PELO|nr:unnamed protein product [Caenorhabditis auriculariae]
MNSCLVRYDAQAWTRVSCICQCSMTNELRENLSEALGSLKEKVAEQWEVMTGVEAPKDELNAQENYENLSGSDQQNVEKSLKMLSRTQFIASNTSRVYFQNAQRMAGTDKGVIGSAVDKTIELAREAKHKIQDSINAVTGEPRAEDQARYKTKDAVDAAADKAKELRDKASDTWQDLKDKASEKIDHAQDMMKDSKHKADCKVEGLKREASQKWEELKHTAEQEKQHVGQKYDQVSRDAERKIDNARDQAGEKLKQAGRDIQKH